MSWRIRAAFEDGEPVFLSEATAGAGSSSGAAGTGDVAAGEFASGRGAGEFCPLPEPSESDRDPRSTPKYDFPMGEVGFGAALNSG